MIYLIILYYFVPFFRLEAEAIYRAQLERYTALARSSLLPPVTPYPSGPLLYNPGSELINPNPIISTSASTLSTLLSSTTSCTASSPSSATALSGYTQHLNSNSTSSSLALNPQHQQVFQDALSVSSSSATEKIIASEKSEPPSSSANIITPTTMTSSGVEESVMMEKVKPDRKRKQSSSSSSGGNNNNAAIIDHQHLPSPPKKQGVSWDLNLTPPSTTVVPLENNPLRPPPSLATPPTVVAPHPAEIRLPTQPLDISCVKNMTPFAPPPPPPPLPVPVRPEVTSSSNVVSTFY